VFRETEGLLADRGAGEPAGVERRSRGESGESQFSLGEKERALRKKGLRQGFYTTLEVRVREDPRGG